MQQLQGNGFEGLVAASYCCCGVVDLWDVREKGSVSRRLVAVNGALCWCGFHLQVSVFFMPGVHYTP